MREHPIPQDITGYRFHIIGSMTLKQFAEIAAGCIGGLVIYATNLLPIFKWPLISMSVGLGAALAFLPFEERPLDHWVTTFVRVMYRPTKFFWRRNPKLPEAFTFTAVMDASATLEQVDLTPVRRQRIKDYLATVQKQPTPNQIDEAENARLDEILRSFQTVTPRSVEITKHAEKPDLKVRVRSLKSTHAEPEEVVVYNQTSPLSKQQMAATDVALGLEIPGLELIATEKAGLIASPLSVTQASASLSHVSQEDLTRLSPTMSPSNSASAVSASLNAELPFPEKPTLPNLLVGMILTPTNELIPEAIVEIQDQTGRVVRAVKTNALGQFYVSTALDNGAYTLLAEKDNYRFSPQQITLTGETVDPLEIHSLV